MTLMNAPVETTPTHLDYIKIYLTLIALFVVSMLGPLFGAPILVTILLAFSIAVFKAGLVTAYFMHLNIEKRYIWFILFVMLTFMVVLYAGVAPDVMKQSGQNWRRVERSQEPAINVQ
jgi:caa(3)-type oxidase subunit IV